jgi:hypothetical protein
VEEKIKAALLAFDWFDYDEDEMGFLAEEDPDVGIFDALATKIAEALAA